MKRMSRWRLWKTRIFQWEFWPFSFLYFPLFLFYGLLSLRERSFFFFTASNPSFDFGGMMGESKFDIFKRIPEAYIPKTVRVDAEDRAEMLKEAGRQIGYPLIVKPDVGERGMGIRSLKNEEELLRHKAKFPFPFLVQELVTYPVELGVFYVRKPNEKHGRVTSVVQKDFLSVTGDGQSSVEELLQRNVRALLQVDTSNPELSPLLKIVPEPNEKIIVEPIGNHCRGTTFLDITHEVDEALEVAIDAVAKSIPGFHYGRFDLRCASLDDLKNLRNFKIMELNGAGAEPAHIYQPGFSLWKAYGVLFWHLKVLADISRENRRLGAEYWPFAKGWEKFRETRAYNRRLARL
jgi:hypothetical protein